MFGLLWKFSTQNDTLNGYGIGKSVKNGVKTQTHVAIP